MSDARKKLVEESMVDIEPEAVEGDEKK